MPSLNFEPIFAAVLPWLAVALGAAVALVGVAVGVNYARQELRRRQRRPAHASAKRSMIVVNRSGAAVLDDMELQIGDELEIRIPVPRGQWETAKPAWVKATLQRRRSDGLLILVLSNNVGLPAAGQKVRWPSLKQSKKVKETISYLRVCQRCQNRLRREICLTCERGKFKEKLRHRSTLPEAVARMLK